MQQLYQYKWIYRLDALEIIGSIIIASTRYNIVSNFQVPNHSSDRMCAHRPRGFSAVCFFSPPAPVAESVVPLTLSPPALTVFPKPDVTPPSVSPTPFPAPETVLPTVSVTPPTALPTVWPMPPRTPRGTSQLGSNIKGAFS